jgi:hypothetical protein
MKIFLAVMLAALPAAAQTPEAAQLRGASGFNALSAFKFDPKAAMPPVLHKAVEPAPAKPKASRYVTVSGTVNLQGSGFLSGRSGFVTVNFSGYTTVQDVTGSIRSDMANINAIGQFFVNNGGFVNGTVWPNAYVSLYQNGKYLGQANLNGTVFVSGWANGNWLSMNGSGNLSGTVLVSD